MRQVPPHCLWLGNALDARDLRQLYEREIAAVIDLAIDEPPAQLGRDIIYCRFPLTDGSGNPDWLLRLAILTTMRLLQDAVATLIACSGGMSRTPAIAAAAIAGASRNQPENCLLEIVAGQPHDVSPLLWQDVKQALLACSASQAR